MRGALREVTVEGDEESRLIDRAIKGEEAAFASLYRAHSRHVAGTVYRLLGSDADLDDIVQETFVDGLRSLAALEDRTRLRAYLVRIAIRKVHKRISFLYRFRHFATELFGVTPTVSDPEARDEVHALAALLGRSPARHRIAWTLHRVEGFTLPEVADHCEASLATVKRWIAAIDANVEAADA